MKICKKIEQEIELLSLRIEIAKKSLENVQAIKDIKYFNDTFCNFDAGFKYIEVGERRRSPILYRRIIMKYISREDTMKVVEDSVALYKIECVSNRR